MRESLVDLEHGGEAAEMVLGKPPRLLRASIYVLTGLIVSALLWAYFSRIDIVISAPGAVRPLGDLAKVQSLVTGRLLEVRAREGDQVKAGDVLFLIDGKETQAELEKTLARFDASRKQLETLKGSREALVIQQQAEEARDRIGIQSSEGELEKSKKNREQSQASLDEADARLAEAQSDFDRTKKLVEGGVLSQAELQKKEAALKTAKAVKEGAEARFQISGQEVSLFDQALSLKRKQAEIYSEERRRTISDLDNRLLALSDEAKGHDLEAGKLRTALGHLEVKAPSAGTVTTLAVKNSGEVVRAGDPLGTIAPEGSPWIVEALVTNKDAGPLRQKVGGRVKLKFDAFNFRDYGVVEGKLLDVSPDSTAHEKLGPVFRVKVSFDTLEIGRGNKKGRIGLGMTATVEIVKEEERILLLLFREVRDRVSVD